MINGFINIGSHYYYYLLLITQTKWEDAGCGESTLIIYDHCNFMVNINDPGF